MPRRQPYGPLSSHDDDDRDAFEMSPPSSARSSNARFLLDDVKSPDPNRATFRSSVALIPDPDLATRPPKYEPFAIRLWVVAIVCMLFIGIGIGLEVATQISHSNGGFAVPEKNVFQSIASVQTLTSFFPVLFVIPLHYLVFDLDSKVLSYEPYIALSRGNAPADESIMLHYHSAYRFQTIWTALKRRHKLLLISSATVVTSWIFQPLASSIFAIKDMPQPSFSTVTSQRLIGVNPNIADLTAFESAAGYAEAAVYNKLVDPPFVFNGYSVAQFDFPTTNTVNGSMSVNTSAVHTTLNCAAPISMTLDNTNTSNFVLTATSVDGCTLGPVNWNPSDAPQRYSVVSVPNCAALPEPGSDQEFQPVFFWFWQNAALLAQAPGGRNNAAGVFCVPSLQLSDVAADASLASGFLTGVTKTGTYDRDNNVTGGQLNGRAFNGLFFSGSFFNASADVNVNARANAIVSGVPHAIFQSAIEDPLGLQAVFDNVDGFVNKTLNVYTQYLALAATSVYFVEANQTASSILTQLKPRLVIQPVPAHFLASIFFVIGLVVMGVHIVHYRARRDVYLPMTPGPLALAIAQTARSGFGQMLYPYDSRKRMRAKLTGLRFKLDRRTGAIVVDDDAVLDAGYGYRPADEKDGVRTYNAVDLESEAGGSKSSRGGPEDSMRKLTGGAAHRLSRLQEEEWVPPRGEGLSASSSFQAGPASPPADERMPLV